jgi:hypothetical protein
MSRKYRGQSGWGVKLTTQLHLVPRLRMRGAMPSLTQHFFMEFCLIKLRDNLTFYITFYNLIFSNHFQQFM